MQAQLKMTVWFSASRFVLKSGELKGDGILKKLGNYGNEMFFTCSAAIIYLSYDYFKHTTKNNETRNCFLEDFFVCYSFLSIETSVF